MIRKFCFFFLLAFLFLKSYGQFVSIPDAAFKMYLQQQYPNCFNAQGKLDTTCSAFIQEHNLIVPNMGISNLEGMQYMDALTYIRCEGNQLTQLPSLPPNIGVLECSNNLLTQLPPFPSQIAYLNCTQNQLSQLPDFPASLGNVHCEHNQLTSLPNLLNPSFYNLDCSYNLLTTLPPLPNAIGTFNCSHNQLTSLPYYAVASSSGGRTLNCSYNMISNLPNLPSNLGKLDCSHNNLTALPTVSVLIPFINCSYNQLSQLSLPPDNISQNQYYIEINCSHNQLTNLPKVFPTKLDCSYNQISNFPMKYDGGFTYLDISHNLFTQIDSIGFKNSWGSYWNIEEFNCSYNQIGVIDTVFFRSLFDCSHNNLQVLGGAVCLFYQARGDLLCNDNQLVSLNYLKNLGNIYCQNNQLAHISEMPFLGLICNNNPNLSCLPAIPSTLQNLDISNTAISCIPNPNPFLNLPICSNNCLSSSYAKGRIFIDNNNNQIWDAGDMPLPNKGVIASKTNYSSLNVNAFSNLQGEYLLQPLSDIFYYDWKITAANFSPYYLPTPSHYNISITPTNLSDSLLDFAFSPIPNKQDVEVYVLGEMPQAGQNAKYHILCKNVGTLAANGTIKITLGANENFIAANPAPVSQTGNVISWNLANLQPLADTTFWVEIHLNQFPAMSIAEAQLTNTDETPNNNKDTFAIAAAQILPYKESDKAYYNYGQSLDNEYITYHIFFQNNTNQTVNTISIYDSLPEYLSVGNLQVLNQSHLFEMYSEGQNKAIWQAKNVNLAPNASGFISFRTKFVEMSYLNPMQIQNCAKLYLDNQLSLTNCAQTNVSFYTFGIGEETEQGFWVYPNPSDEVVNIRFNKLQNTNYQLLNINGVKVKEGILKEIETEVSIVDLPKGVYVLLLYNENGFFSKKILKE